jgi:hypothetical protein
MMHRFIQPIYVPLIDDLSARTFRPSCVNPTQRSARFVVVALRLESITGADDAGGTRWVDGQEAGGRRQRSGSDVYFYH